MSRGHLASQLEEARVSKQLFLDESKMGNRSWQTALPRFFETGVNCAQLCPSSNSQKLLDCGLPQCCETWTVSSSVLAPQLGSGEGWKMRKRGSCWRHQRVGASTSWLHVWVKNKKLIGGRGHDSCFACQSTGGCSFPSNRWALDSCNKV